jgi:putative N6-adenine-specific DNA methylase
LPDFNKEGIISITCPKGMVPYLSSELQDLGFSITKKRPAGVETNGSLNDCMKLNLRLRCAHRVHFHIGSFKASNANQLKKVLSDIPWEDYIPDKGYFSITSFIKNPTITNTQYANLVMKDAIVDRFREETANRPDSGPRLDQTVLFLFWKGDRADVYLDTSGESISRRNYKSDQHTASMQETLAASIIMASRWEPELHFINPMCGSGTLAIEAALMALNRAPGMLRPNFGIKHIKGFDEQALSALRSELKQATKKNLEGRIIATDHDPKAIQAAEKNAKTAGVDQYIEFKCCPFGETEIPEGEGVVVFNPPYGQRLGEEQKLQPIYREIGDFFKQHCSGKWGYVFTGNFKLAKQVGLRSSRRIEMYNSTIECRLLEFELY